jgi:hypothetical protein
LGVQKYSSGSFKPKLFILKKNILALIFSI